MNALTYESLISLPAHSEKPVHLYVHRLLSNYPLASLRRPLSNFFPIQQLVCPQQGSLSRDLYLNVMLKTQ